MKTIYQTKITVTVLSEYKITDMSSIQEIVDECVNGDLIGKMNFETLNVPLSGIVAVQAIRNTGSDPGFFMMDENGNEEIL